MACQTLAKVLKYSVGHPDAPPLLSVQIRQPRIIHAEIMTHRVFSRNARSSRAVPVPRMLEEIRDEPFIPRYWGANQKGMQAGAEHDALMWISKPVEQGGSVLFVEQSHTREEAWLTARDRAVEVATALHEAGYHKQVVNRLLEPFMHIDLVVTGTQWSNFLALRDHDMAEPHIRDVARALRAAIEEFGPPTQLGPGEWHLPYVDDDTKLLIGRETPDNPEGDWGEACLHTARAVSVTRCAQVSYTPFHEARLTVAEEVARHDALVSAQPMHASPAEHQATPDTRLANGEWANPHLAGNLGPGWIQYRKTLAGECA